MYKKSEHLLPFYSPIEETPQAQICHLDMHLRKSDPVFFFLFSFYELMSAAWVSFFCCHSVNSIYSLKKKIHLADLILQTV